MHPGGRVQDPENTIGGRERSLNRVELLREHHERSEEAPGVLDEEDERSEGERGAELSSESQVQDEHDRHHFERP